YRPFLHVALRSPRVTLALGALSVLSCLPIAARLGGEFLPEVDEGTLLYMPTTRADVLAHDAEDVLRAIDALLTRQPGVASAFGKVGRAESATDPAPYAMAEVTIRLRPPALRPPTTAETIASLDRALTVPGWSNAWTQPIRGRIDMVATGSQAPVVVRLE